MSTTTFPRLTSNGVELDTSPESFGWLRESNDVAHDIDALRSRLNEDGYLYLPGFLHRPDVEAVRQKVCEVLAGEGLLDPEFPMEAAMAKPGIDMQFRPDIANHGESSASLRGLIYGPQMMSLYTSLFAEDAMHYDFTWMRVIAPGPGTYPHCDVVYMGRGTENVLTAWVPLGDVPLEVGGLIVLEGSHESQELREGYCKLDVDTSCINTSGHSNLNEAGYPGFGILNMDAELVRKWHGKRWLTAREYRMGDLLTFSIHLVHGSLDNQSRAIRISSDSRYQPASQPADERWIGENPPGHGGAMVKGMIC